MWPHILNQGLHNNSVELTFADNSQDDSVETSKLGIAYSYLAIILGYVYLGHAELPLPTGLLPAIQHFIAINKTLNNKTAELEHLVYSLRRLR